MNKFYVQEGNKRVSILKYFDAVSVPGYVTRILPPRTDQKENKLYYEFVDFAANTYINYIWFTKPGSFVRLQAAFGKEPKMSGQMMTGCCSVLFIRVFQEQYESLGGKKLSITTGDAFLAFLTIYNYEVIDQKTTNEMKELVAKTWKNSNFWNTIRKLISSMHCCITGKEISAGSVASGKYAETEDCIFVCKDTGYFCVDLRA